MHRLVGTITAYVYIQHIYIQHICIQHICIQHIIYRASCMFKPIASKLHAQVGAATKYMYCNMDTAWTQHVHHVVWPIAPKVATAPPREWPHRTTRPTLFGPPVRRAAALSSVSRAGPDSASPPLVPPAATACSPSAPSSCWRKPVWTDTPACHGKSSACSCCVCLRSCNTSYEGLHVYGVK